MTSNFTCYGATQHEMEVHKEVAFWIEVVACTIVGGFGIIGNLFSLPILASSSPRMNTCFNKLAAGLALLDTSYIIFRLLDTLRRKLQLNGIFLVLHAFVTYPIMNVLLFSLVLIPITLAYERYQSIKDPIGYFNTTKGRNLTKMVICKYILPILVISILANSPTLFEFQMLTQSQHTKKFDPVTNQTVETCEVAYSVAGTWLKFNQFYVTFYKNFVRSFLFGVLPFIILVILNWKIYHSIRSSDRRYPNLMFKQPLVLFAICFLFLITHSVRIILAFHRLIYREQFATALENRCNPHQLWTLMAASVSRFLLIFNSSVNFAIYCFISRDFRATFLQRFGKSKLGLVVVTYMFDGKRQGSTSTITHQI